MSVCPPGHRHAETANCYVRHKCRCEACRGRRKTDEKRRADDDRGMHERPCKRCGVTRLFQRGERARPLCRDCKSVLSKEEAAAWV